MEELLKVSGIEAFYGASQALFGVNLKVGRGQVVALMGRNGMGKTTTIRAICGLSKIAVGKAEFCGTDIKKKAAYQVARLGIGLVPEGRRCFANLTVRENLLVAARQGENNAGSSSTQYSWDLEAVGKLFPRLSERSEQMADTLSGGEQQMLAIGRALMTNPKLLILDEATEGLAPVIRQEIWRAIKVLKGSGLSILVVDKTLSELLPVADYCVLIERGVTVWSGSSELMTEALQQQYLGV